MRTPDPLHLPDHLRSTDPDSQREAILNLAGQADWVSLSWPDFLEALIALGRTDITLSRLTEGHVDALRILHQAGAEPEAGALYGVWASRSGGTGLSARPSASGWHLSGRLMFASGAGVLDRALVTAWPDDETHVLLDARVRDWPFDTTQWHTRAMEFSRSHRVQLDQEVEARQVGEENFYLDRWGFFPGGVGVAAVWAGGAARVLDLLGDQDQGAKRVRFGRAQADLAAALAVVRQAGVALEERPADPQRLATLARAGVAAAVRRVLDEARAIAGPAGLAFDEDLTRAVDDLALYVAQQNADSDAHYLGSPGPGAGEES
ncbi:MAG: acyl-CoA dehydrogenase [bacterium]|nr:acyl-CoA dehydrogenase [bacterium]